MIGISNNPAAAEDTFRSQCHDKTLRLKIGSPVTRFIVPALDAFDMLMCMHAVMVERQSELNAILKSEDRQRFRVYALGTEMAVDGYLAELQRKHIDVCLIEDGTRDGAFVPRRSALGYLAPHAGNDFVAIGIMFLGKDSFKIAMEIAC